MWAAKLAVFMRTPFPQAAPPTLQSYRREEREQSEEWQGQQQHERSLSLEPDDWEWEVGRAGALPGRLRGREQAVFGAITKDAGACASDCWAELSGA